MSSMAADEDTNDTSSGDIPVPSVKIKENNDAPKRFEFSLGNEKLDLLAIQAGLVVVALFFLYTILTTLWTAASGAASSAASQLPGALLGLITAILAALWEGAKIAIPALAHFLGTSIQVAAPVVQQASHAVGEAASPYIDEAARSLGEAAAPYVEQLNTAVDTQLVVPLSNTVDTQLVTPIKTITDSVTGSVTSGVDATMNQVTSSVAGATDQAVNSIKRVLPFWEVHENVLDIPDEELAFALQKGITGLDKTSDEDY